MDKFAAMSPLAVTKAAATHAQGGGDRHPLRNRLLPFATVCLLACCLLFAELGRYPLFNPDEALYAEPAREMLENGDFITTYLNYVVRFTKPPLVIWAQALGISLFGVNEFAVRFFEAACGLLLVAATYLFSEKFAGRRAAIAASIALATAPLFIGTGREAITDMPLSLFMAGAMICFFTALRTAKHSYLWTAWGLLGLAVMTKGPVGLVLPLCILAAFAFLNGRLKSIQPDFKVIQGLAIVAIIALPWFITEISITKGAYFHEFILRENVQRFTSAIDSHGQPWWYHIAAMFAGFLPWSLFLPGSIAALLPQLINTTHDQASALLQAWPLRRFSVPRLKLPALRWPQTPTQELAGVDPSLGLFCLLWAAITLLFFSASVSKLLPYTMPAFPALAVLFALEAERILQTGNRKRALIPVAIIAVAFGASNAILPFALKKLRDAPPGLIDLIRSFTTFELVFSMAALAFTARKMFRSAWFIFCLPTVLGMLFFGGKILNSLSAQWEGPLPALAGYAALSNQDIFVYDMRKPSIPFYTRRKIVQPASPAELITALQQSGSAYIITKTKTSAFIKSIEGCKIIRQEGSFLLAAYRRPPQGNSN